MNGFEIREIPSRRRRTGVLAADALKANVGKAVFVAANGTKPENVRATGAASFARFGLNVHSSVTPDGVYFWLDENETKGR